MPDTLEQVLPTGCLRRWEACGGGPEHLAALLAVHTRLWDLEDRARSRRAGAAEIADVKRRIDRANADRHHLIDLLDDSLPAVAVGGGATPVPYSETVGELFDRLLVIGIKVLRSGEAACDGELTPDLRDLCDARGRALRAWWGHVGACLERQLDDVAAARASLPPRAEFKMYNHVELNPVTRRENRPVSVTAGRAAPR